MVFVCVYVRVGYHQSIQAQFIAITFIFHRIMPNYFAIKCIYLFKLIFNWWIFAPKTKKNFYQLIHRDMDFIWNRNLMKRSNYFVLCCQNGEPSVMFLAFQLFVNRSIIFTIVTYGKLPKRTFMQVLSNFPWNFCSTRWVE